MIGDFRDKNAQASAFIIIAIAIVVVVVLFFILRASPNKLNIEQGNKRCPDNSYFFNAISKFYVTCDSICGI